MRFILEHSLSPKLALALAALEGQGGHDVVHLRNWYQQTADDPTWLTGLRERGEGDSVVVTADTGIYRNPAVKVAWLESGLTVVFLKSFADLPHWDQAAKLVKWWPDIVAEAARAKKGTGLVVSVNGKILPLKG